MWLMFGLAVLLSVGSIEAATLAGTVVAVADGDTLTVLVNKRQHKVRLGGIDCPEQKQSYGQVAKQYTAQQVFQQPVTIVTTERDRYGRWIGLVVLEDGRVLNHSLVDEGLCWAYVQYNKDPVLNTLEQQARVAKRGLWGQEGNPTPPWEFRRQKKGGMDGRSEHP